MIKVLNFRPVSKGANLMAYATVQYSDAIIYFVGIVRGGPAGFFVALPNRKFNGRPQEILEFRDKKKWAEFCKIVLDAYDEFCTTTNFKDTIKIFKTTATTKSF